ncbi:MAG: hypothetical protein AAFX41_10435, partial [Bacteroidota bacterium]
MNVTVRSARLGHTLRLGPALRYADKQEIEASVGMDPTSALAESLEVSDRAWTAFLGPEPI